VIAAAKCGARSTGIELDAELINEAKRCAAAAAVEEPSCSDLIHFAQADLMSVDLSEATVLCMFLLPETLNGPLQTKLAAAVQRGARVITIIWPLAGDVDKTQEWNDRLIAGSAEEGFFVYADCSCTKRQLSRASRSSSNSSSNSNNSKSNSRTVGAEKTDDDASAAPVAAAAAAPPPAPAEAATPPAAAAAPAAVSSAAATTAEAAAEVAPEA
jgi:hypothetical protein